MVDSTSSGPPIGSTIRTRNRQAREKLEQLRGRQPPGFHRYPPLRETTGIDVGAVKPAERSDHEEASREAQSEPKSLSRVEPVLVPATASLATANLPNGAGPLTTDDAVRALEAFREQVIRPSITDYEPNRSILRPAMIECLFNNGWPSLEIGTHEYLNTCERELIRRREKVFLEN